jgi:ABC-type multidrug transport system permease subunit
VPLSVSTVVGALGVLGCALFGRFLLGVTRLPGAFKWLTYVAPLGYAFEVRSSSYLELYTHTSTVGML